MHDGVLHVVGRPQPPRLSLPIAAAALYTTHSPRSIDAATSTSAFSTASSQTRSRTHSIHQLPSYSRSRSRSPSSRDVSHTLTLHHITRLSLRVKHFFLSFVTVSTRHARPNATAAHARTHGSNHSYPFCMYTPAAFSETIEPLFHRHTHSYRYTLLLLCLHLNHAPPVAPDTFLFPEIHSDPSLKALTDTCVRVCPSFGPGPPLSFPQNER